ncbi:beta-N-acetylhexosaminidase family protein [Xanthomonas hortorum]|uniref:Beta-N-acetylglucosaminidase n=1 Tax=Xanthomonas hortorum pv. pelargonii TaxID=453602 RepID=A0A6V7EWR0_9XANT|nr:beta-N-acetylglucosaminidase domain-containing protein [Xanthomonas hortorum]MCE4355757.1 beta-N-acetylglucosaminidase domain-containing protein [Xanthomonas hortorum pv. pelargonii]MCM5523855.1 beta-N-acetylglucosaminidase domain-containing protein [Xanthomonas hortorum pv. pelargonii]MCM5536102.1 beta-N-acetylglucosaminidase domain-containing protein [Xanthomonas hortorum pv. pelargonii]MCM5540343.1 beta-N-acetylglucosaminidase domain-containing protein [Xanthomonas hortorum pv. pelargonii
MKRRDGKSGLRLLPVLVALSLTAPALAQPVTQPAIFPTPTSIALEGGTVTLGRSVVLVVAPGADPASVALVRRILGTAGVTKISTASRLPATLDRPHIVLGTDEAAVVRDALTRSKAAQDTHKEGYTLASVALGNGSLITLAGHDNDGLFHAAQTLRQLVERPAIPTLVIQDHPAMPIRGTIEGFYGAPWSMADRTKHLEFLARTKANTFIYSPKDDPYARDRWREAYPAATLKALGKLAATAKRNHVDFVYAISPGPTVCFSDPADAKALLRKFDAFRKLGVRSFYVALDDIEYTKWNCERDKTTFGDSGAQAAGIAQSHLLNLVQADLVARHDASSELIMVPTEYFDAKESPYKEALRKHLDPKVVVQWTGTDVVPPAISIPDARAATKAFGRKTLLWDNYPVNDFETSAGRLLMAPYARREAGLSAELSGIVSNPMNQEVPSRVAVMGLTAFAWNDKDYDAQRTWHAAARDLAGGDAQVTAALLTFFDTQHLAPTFGSQPWQEQAPRLKAVLDHVREMIALGDAAARSQAIAELARTADEIAAAPQIIREGVADKGFAEQARPWLDAMQRWGRALQQTAAGLDAANRGDAQASRAFADAKQSAAEAAAIPSIPGATRFGGPVKIADGVLDRFVADAPRLIAYRAQATAEAANAQ